MFKILDAEANLRLSKSSLRALLWCRQWADFTRCTFKVSLRTLAKSMKSGKTTAGRGLDDLIGAGIIRPTGEYKAGCRVFEIVVPKSIRTAHRRDDRGEEREWE